MEEQHKTIYKWVDRVVIGLFVILMLFLFAQKLVISGQVNYHWGIKEQTRFIKGPYPEGRVDFSVSPIKIKAEPIYFDVYAPRHFNQAVVKIKMNKPENLVAKLGIRQKGSGLWYKGGEWAFDLQPLQDVEEQTLTFDLRKANFNNNRLQFILSAPGVESANIELQSVDFQLNNFNL